MLRQTGNSEAEPAELDRVHECAAAIIRLLAEGRPDDAESVVDSVARRCHGTSCKAFYHSLISTCGKADGPGSALWCALKMVRVGFKANVVTYNSLLQSCVRTGHVNSAREFWDQMLEVGVSPNAISYHTMLHTCVSANDLRLAEKWIMDMHAADMVTTTAANIVIFAFAREGACAKADQWFQWMQEAGVSKDHTTYNAMIHSRLKAKKLAEAERWIAEMHYRGLWPDVQAYNGIILAYADAGLVQRAEFWRRQMELQDYYPSEAALDALAAAAQAQDPERRTPAWADAATPASDGARHPGEAAFGLRSCGRGSDHQNAGPSSSCAAAVGGLESQATSSSSSCQRVGLQHMRSDVAPMDDKSFSSAGGIRSKATDPQALTPSGDEVPYTRLRCWAPSSSEVNEQGATQVNEQGATHVADRQEFWRSPSRAVEAPSGSSACDFERFAL